MTDVRLRKLGAEYLDLVADWRNAHAEFFPPQPPFTWEGQVRWFEGAYANDPSDHMFIVFADDEPTGTIAINSRTREIGRVLLGVDSYERQGVMSEALRQLCEAFGGGYAWLKVLASNHRAIRFYKRNGFSKIEDSPRVPEDGNEWVIMGRIIREGEKWDDD